ncbi:phosphotyrosine protein phosphatase [Candidatus Woesearchaeota archaeon]|nr:phosphotyrosine protein phosphatase [Candidatus Woesearchaeota archaeon]
MNVLFICNQNRNRSKLAEHIFQNKFNTQSAGLYNSKPLHEKQLRWADIVVVMEEEQRQEVEKRFPELSVQKRILSFDIPDVYNYDNPQLKEILEMKSKRFSKYLS